MINISFKIEPETVKSLRLSAVELKEICVEALQRSLDDDIDNNPGLLSLREKLIIETILIDN